VKKALIVASLTIAAAASHAVVIFDSITQATSGVTTTGSVPHSRMADGFAAVAGNWHVTELQWATFVFGATTPTTLNNVTLELKVWGTSNNGTSGTTPVFGNNFYSITFNLGNVSQLTTAQAFLFTVDMTAQSLNFGSTGLTDWKGAEWTYKVGGVQDDRLAMGITTQAPVAVGGALDGFYRDANANGVIEGSDFRNFAAPNDHSNIMMKMTASPVPEPATLAALGVGIAAMARRRRRSK
jgi:hypothetical protein